MSASAGEQKERKESERLIASLDTLIEKASIIAGRLEEVAMTTLGPEANKGPAGEVKPADIFDSFCREAFEKQQILGDVLNRISAAVTRLEGF